MNQSLVKIHATLLALGSSKIVTGTQSLLNDASKALLIILPIIAAVMIIFCSIRKSMSDEHEIPMWNKRIAGVIIGATIGISASGIVAVISSYYSG